MEPLTSKKKKKKKGKEDFTVERVDAANLELTPIVKPQPPVPRLAYGLDRVLFNPGVYHIQDPRSLVYNFDPYLARIMPIKEFDFNALKQYITSSKDLTLIKTAAEHKKKYTGSTSSMTSTLAHFHYLLSAWRRVNPAMLSRNFEIESYNFTRINRAPAATFLHWKDGTYAIDADKEFDTANILSMLGKSMEKFLTLPKEEFEKYRRSRSDQLSDEERNGPESYHYTTLGDFMMRSQLDAHDPRLPGTGMFDLKTRAVISIRMDARDFQKGLGYEIRSLRGQWESFEREYYDMIRSAFLKYSLQVRMGRMDGIFVAFHNTQRIFGFQYIPISEMDLAIHGQADTSLGDREFKLSVHLLNKVLDKITAKFPGRSLRLHFETRGEGTPFMYVFAKPVTPEEIEETQGARRAVIEEFERRMMGISRETGRGVEEEDSGDEVAEEDLEDDLEAAKVEEETSLDTWEDVMSKVEDELEDEEHGVTFVREAIENALQESGLLSVTGSEGTQRYVDAFLDALTNNGPESSQNQPDRPSEAERPADADDGTAKADDAASSAPAAATPARSPSKEGRDGAQPTTDDLTLKDLIVKLATQIRAAPKEQRVSSDQVGGQADEDVPAEERKRRRIEQILSELAVKYQAREDAEKGEENRVVETGSLSVEQKEGAEETVESQVTSTEEPEEAAASSKKAGNGGEQDKKSSEPASDELYGLILTVRNKIDGDYVIRPQHLTSKQRWVVEYAMEEIPQSRAKTLYNMVLNRRKKLLDPDKDDDTRWYHLYRGDLDKYSKKGRKFRNLMDERHRHLPVYVYGSDTPYTWESVFGENAGDGTKPYEIWEPPASDDTTTSSATGTAPTGPGDLRRPALEDLYAALDEDKE